ncbi:cytochrome P450 family protein [Streptomyces griseorubiginosus]|uniref:cytochrome P450 n=1 Tax=Streptomyces griseorubiginosus TaxID=67304 RepID=UPI0036E178C7
MQNHPDTTPEIPPGCPAHGNVALYGPQFGSDIEGTYEYLRSLGPIAPVDIAPDVEVELVTSYDTALKILHDPTTFVRDSRRWNALNEGRVPADSPALPMMGYRPNALFADGARHARLRQAVTESLATVDELQLVRQVQQSAGYLISSFGARGQADLMTDYAGPLPLLVFSELFGCPAEIGDRVIAGISGIFEGTPGADETLGGALMELIGLKRRSPGADLTTRLMVHPAQLTDEEVLHQLVTLLSGGTAPLTAAIGTATALYLSEDWAEGLSVEDAVAQTLWKYPPIANYAAHYPTHDVEVDGRTLRAGDPVLISFAAANNDPQLAVHREQLSSKAHLAFGAGPHACPAKDPAVMIVISAVEALLNRLHDVETRIAFKSLAWSEGPWSRSLVTVPIRFTPPLAPAAAPAAPKATETVRPVASPTAPTASRPAHAAPAKGLFSRFLAWTRGE